LFRGLDLGFFEGEILKPLKWTNITSFLAHLAKGNVRNENRIVFKNHYAQ
jgi:hypothetical protein